MNVILFIHLVGFGLGLGAVIFIDLVGLLWVFGKTTVSKVSWLSGIAQKIIWTAVIIQVISGGILLEPVNVTSGTKIKLFAVVVLAVNGLFLDRIRHQLIAYEQDDFWKLPRKFQVISVGSISLSQLCWWTATIIGFIAATSS
ncbi:MAG: hypothetical protein WCI47_00985 [bacterium]